MAVSARSFRSVEDKSIFLSLAKSSLKVNLEPIIDARSGRLIACEALMRGVQHLGFATPFDLLDHADQIGAIVELDVMMARKAIDAIVDYGWPRPRLFINIDGRTMPDWKTYRDEVLFHAQSAGLSAAEICCEISEVRQVLAGEDLRAAIEGLRDCGFRIAIDDFGTGVSGLQMLYHTQPNFLKIDRFFVQTMPTDAHKRLLVNAITQLAHTLGARVIAEGVETEAELQACRQADCGLIQGYLVKPPEADLTFLKSHYTLPDKTDAETDMDARLSKVLQQPPTVTVDVTLKELFHLYHSGVATDVLPVMDRSGMLMGGIFWRRLRPLLGSKYGEALSQNTSYSFQIQDMIEPMPCFEVRQPLAQAIDLVADKARDGVMVVDRGQYVGFLSPYDLMKLANSVMLTEAQRKNPLSGLPGNETINELVTDLETRPDQNQLVCYIDISDFKPFNDKFGFELGDRAILILCDLLKRIGDITGAFVGHIGGDDFIVIHEAEVLDAVTSLLERVPADFESSTSSLFPEDVQNAKQYQGRDRSGRARTIPVIGITVVGNIFSPGQQVLNPTELASQLANLKSKTREAMHQVAIQDAF